MKPWQRGAGGSTGAIVLAIYGCLITAWITHVVVSIKASSWGLLVAGAIFFPVGMVHGIGVWLTVW